MKFEIKNWATGGILFSVETDSWKLAVEAAIKAKANLSYANLSSANLSYANLSSADLRSADLSYANLSYANLRSANLSSADLCSANLSYANLRSADLRSADLRSADLSSADLRYANLSYANLSSADLRSADLRSADLSSADLRSADLSSANLSSADLRDVKNASVALAQTMIVPQDGPFFGWKRCRDGVMVKVAVGGKAKRSNGAGRKIRAEYVKVLEVVGAEFGISQYDGQTKYEVGKIVRCDKWNEDRWNECSGGIHLFLTREEAEQFQL